MADGGRLTPARIESAIIFLAGAGGDLEFVTWERGERPWLQLVVEPNGWLTVNASSDGDDPRPQLAAAGISDIAPNSIEWEAELALTFTLALDVADEAERLLAVDRVLRLLDDVLGFDRTGGWSEVFS
jgi:hypothetical protein